MNSVLEILHTRVSLRRYSSRPITEEDLRAILRTTLRAPTAGNQQLYSIITIRDDGLKARIAELCNRQKFIAAAPVVLVFLADQHKWYRYFKLAAVPEYTHKEGIEWRTPGLPDMLLAFEDAMIAAHTAVIAAESLGIGSCYIGSTLVNYRELAELLELPDHVVPLMALPMGYYPEDYVRKPSKRFDEVFILFNEKYRALDDEELEKMFAVKTEMHHRDANEGTANFAQAFYKRKTGSWFMKRMDESIREVISDWLGER